MRRMIAGLLMLMSLSAGWLWMDYRAAPNRILTHSQPAIVEITRGQSLAAIAELLVERDILDRPWWFRLHAHADGVAGKFKFGEYEIPTGITQSQLLDMLVAGKVKQYAVTIPEGWRFNDMWELLSRQPALDPAFRNLAPEEIMSLLGEPGVHPEGRFYPDTYQYHKGMSALDVLRRAHQKMRAVIEREWQDRAPELPLATPYQALILASIVEKETGRPEERPLIAGVFMRRLDQNMPLQTDPTVIYGLGHSYQGKLHKDDLQRDTPYNTYVHRGLPPTPIALPGLQAIRAALHPAGGESLYFVATGDGGHVFSKSLDEHNRAVDHYQRHQP